MSAFKDRPPSQDKWAISIPIKIIIKAIKWLLRRKWKIRIFTR